MTNFSLSTKSYKNDAKEVSYEAPLTSKTRLYSNTNPRNVFGHFFLCTGDGGGPLVCPGPDSLDIGNIFDFGTAKDKQSYCQVS